MDRQILLTAIIAVASVLSLMISTLAGIPEIVRYYPSAITGLLEIIPLDLVSVWGERIGLLLLGLSLGWLAHIRYISDSSKSVDKIEGCVKLRGVLWKGTAKINNGHFVDISVPNKPLCSECQSPMNSSETGSGFNQDFFWKCPSSAHENIVERDFDREDEAVNLFSKHFGRIVESEDEEYSLDSLVESIKNRGGKITSRAIWIEYVGVVDDPDISVDCF
ncbi:hypothetical protein [Halorubrum sp. PV6]|uniref:hypothetical protein n=1 Tax=Halorubrum sp. PV6 TaxID=634157 RepID=UPI000F8DFB02|nr:hypothetical protein [Halorubrum sp. PV6]